MRLDWVFSVRGKALLVSVRGDEPVIASFTLGEAAAPLRRIINVPYLPGQVCFLPDQAAFVCRYLDWTQSHASRCPQGEAAYDAAIRN